jgi:hypothetical protein
MYRTRILIVDAVAHIQCEFVSFTCSCTASKQKFVNWVPEDHESETLTNVP